MAFLWENYSADTSNKGIRVELEWQGEVLPFRIKRVLTIDERQRANEAAVMKIGLDKEGRPVIEKQDQSEFTKQIVLAGLKFWPFEFEPGKPVPITYKTISQLDGGLLDLLARHILGAVAVKREDYDPFVSQSDEASSQEEPVALS
jgi:hypothetical protein